MPSWKEKMNAIGKLGKVLDEYFVPAFGDVLDEYIEDVRREMLAMKVFATRNLMQSFVPTVEKDGDDYKLRLSMDYYWKYVHYGVNGVKQRHSKYEWSRLGLVPKDATWEKFLESLQRWALFKGLPRTIDVERLAHAVRAKGMPPRPFLEKPTQRVRKKLATVVADKVKQILEEQIWR
ncbi:MAG: hypothetical protein KatS3mg038_2186 [Candidatus Kapaibacterium sp.]|nr:MAG: hypothetical protein KatS3mg038_2186 [Candidatus Kapabacteria bacterium]